MSDDRKHEDSYSGLILEIADKLHDDSCWDFYDAGSIVLDALPDILVDKIKDVPDDRARSVARKAAAMGAAIVLAEVSLRGLYFCAPRVGGEPSTSLRLEVGPFAANIDTSVLRKMLDGSMEDIEASEADAHTDFDDPTSFDAVLFAELGYDHGLWN